jgi:hypothetical protein
MSRDASIAFDWADGHYQFRLPLKQVQELQEKTDCGPFFLLQRLINGNWRFEDLRETIRLGLIGGGTEPAKAMALVQRYVDPPRPMIESVAPARLILGAAVMGAPDGEEPGKPEAVKDGEAMNSPEENSPLPPYTELPQP